MCRDIRTRRWLKKLFASLRKRSQSGYIPISNSMAHRDEWEMLGLWHVSGLTPRHWWFVTWCKQSIWKKHTLMDYNIRKDVTRIEGERCRIFWFRTKVLGGILWTLKCNSCLNKSGYLFNECEGCVFSSQKWLCSI